MVESFMFAKLIASPLLVLLLIGCSSGGSTLPDISSTQAISEGSITQSNSENSEVTSVSQSPSRDTVLAVNRCIESSESAINALDLFFSDGAILLYEVEPVQEAMTLASTDCEEAALQAKTDELRQLTAGIKLFLNDVNSTNVTVGLYYLVLLDGENAAWDQIHTDSFRDAIALFLKTTSKFGITSN